MGTRPGDVFRMATLPQLRVTLRALSRLLGTVTRVFPALSHLIGTAARESGSRPVSGTRKLRLRGWHARPLWQGFRPARGVRVRSFKMKT